MPGPDHKFSTSRLLLALAAVLLVPPSPAGARPGPQEPLGAGERIALSRLEQVRTLVAPFQEVLWPKFDPSAVPAVLYQPDGWAIALGFPEPPPGFVPIPGVRDGERPVYRAPRGSFHVAGRSPGLVAGRWAVVSRFEGPAAIPRDGRPGRRNTEEAVADFVGDAFLLYLMEHRKAPRPFAAGVAAYPDSAEATAYAGIEQRLLLQGIRMQFTERNLSDFHRVIKQFVAVRRARYALLGPEVAAAEQEVESWDGLRLYATSHVFRHAASGAFIPPDTSAEDPTYQGYGSSILQRLMRTNVALLYPPDTPAPALGQVADTAAALTFLLDRFVKVAWRTQALDGGRPLIDFAAEQVEMKAEEEPALLEAARAEHHFEAALRLAEADLENLARQRQRALQDAFPAASPRLTLHLAGSRAPIYIDDPGSTVNLGDGRLLHQAALHVETEGLDVRAGLVGREPATPILTRARARRDELLEVSLPLYPVMEVTFRNRRFKPRTNPLELSASEPLLVRGPGLELRAKAGVLKKAKSGDLEIRIDQKSQ